MPVRVEVERVGRSVEQDSYQTKARGNLQSPDRERERERERERARERTRERERERVREREREREREDKRSKFRNFCCQNF